MYKLLGVFIFLGSFSFSQNDFEKYGPYGSTVFTDIKEALKTNSKVYKLDLSYQTIEAKMLDKISELNDLQAIKLGSNSLSKFPQRMEHLVNLVYFASYNNPFEEFLPSLNSFPNLHYLDLHHCKIDSIPSQIAYLSQLNTFKFGNTDDTLKLPNTLKFLKRLKELSFENCILDSFPKQIFQLSGLTFLFLSNTNTKYLSKHFERLPNLEVLVVENNGLTEIPFDIYKAKKLRLLALRGNKLTRLPDSICHLEELTLLDIRGNTFSPEEIEKLKILLPGCEIKF